MNQITAVVYGVGAMNSIAARMMLEKGVTIVGALARSPEKVGKDLGEVAGLGFETGVLVEDDAERVLSTRKPDIATIAVSSYMDPSALVITMLEKLRFMGYADLALTICHAEGRGFESHHPLVKPP